MEMTRYVAPDGFVYDWAEPHIATIKDGDKIEEVEEHLYVKYLMLSKFDDIKNYKIVEDPRGE